MLNKFLPSYHLTILPSYHLTVLRYYGLTVLFIFSVLHVSAQRYPYEFSVYCEGGFNAFIIQKPVNKVSSKRYGGDAGVGFTYFFSQNLGLHTGVGFGFFHVGNGINTLNIITPEREDCDGELALLDIAKRMNLVAAGVKVRVAFQGAEKTRCCR